MKRTLRRAGSRVAVLALGASLIPMLTAPAAQAAGSLQGAASIRTAGGGAALSSGDSATTFTVRLPAGAACTGDSPNDGYRVQTYVVPASVNPSTLTFDATGPVPNGVGATFRQPLYDTTGSPYVDQQTAAADVAGGPGPIINIPNFSYAVFAPGDIPAGSYNIGVACTLGPASATQMKEFWNVQKTFTTAAGGGPAQVNWFVGAQPSAPVLNSLTVSDSQLTANYTAVTSDPPTTLFTVTATPTGGGAAVTASSGNASTTTVTGLTNGTAYSVTVRATNSVGDSPESNALTATVSAAPRPAVQNLTAVAGTGTVALDWDAPTGVAPTGYAVDVNPVGGTVTVTGTSASISGLTAGTLYTFTVTPQHPAPFVGTPASVTATPFNSQVLVQNITVTRPVGAIVLTQVCGKYGLIPADTLGTPGFPSGSLPEVAAAGPGTAPTLTPDGSDPDSKFAEYPYPENPDGTPAPTYPTNCGIELGDAKFVKKGPGGGQFFAAKGVINQMTVVDTRDTDTGWTASGTMGTFTAGAGKTFSGSQLGWTPVKTSDTAPFTDADGNTYDQVVTAGGRVDPNTAAGLGSGRVLGLAAATQGLGIAELDARLKLLIPVTAKSGVYRGTLTLTVTGG